MTAHPQTRTLCYGAALLVLGMAQMVGALTDNATLKGLAVATAASPAPKVFSSVEGLETFSTAFELKWVTPRGEQRALPLTYEVYPRLQGPYNRRNIWGAMLAYGPVLSTKDLTRELFADTIRYGMCGEAPVLRELGIDPQQVDELSIHYTPRDGTRTSLPRVIKRECEP